MKLQSYSMIFVLALAGCGKKASDPTAEMGEHWLVSGPLSDVVEKLSKSKFAEKCDSSEKEMKMEISVAVDKKEEELRANPEANRTDDDQKIIKFKGGALLSLELDKPKAEGYQTYSDAWKSLYKYYKGNLDKQPKSFWPLVNGYARSLVSDDAKRIAGVNMGITEATAPKIEGLLNTATQCSQDTVCVSPEFSKDELETIAAVPYYKEIMSMIANETTSSNKRTLVKKFVERLGYDQARYGFKINDSLAVKKTGDVIEITLPIITKGYSDDDRKTLTNLIARWTNKSHQLKFGFADVQDKSIIAKFFTLFFDDQPGQRDFTDRENREIHMIQYGDSRRFAHEVGHALGFPDHYYAVWDGENCLYNYRHNEEDLMSDHNSGTVTDDEWTLLDKNYPVK